MRFSATSYARQLLCWVLGLCLLPAWLPAAEVEARLDWMRSVSLSTAVNGVVDTVVVEKGQRVSSGQVLLTLVDRTFEAELAAKRAGLKRAENNRDEAERELERTQELYDRTLLSDHDLQLARIQRDAAEAELQAAQTALVQAEQNLYYSRIRAPFEAWVLQRNAEPGQTVVVTLQAEPLLVLAEAGRMLARAAVSGATADTIKPGQQARVTVAGKHYDGRVRFVALQPRKPGVDEYAVEVAFASGRAPLRVGQRAKLDF